MGGGGGERLGQLPLIGWLFHVNTMRLVRQFFLSIFSSFSSIRAQQGRAHEPDTRHHSLADSRGRHGDERLVSGFSGCSGERVFAAMCARRREQSHVDDMT